MRHEALLGRKVAGRFTITRFLGEGGMASVFVAERDAEPRRVALKIMNPELTADREFVRRFQREAKAAARVRHPNSVKIFEYGIDGALSYIVMELLVGDDLYVLLEQHGAISQVRAVRILAEVCDTLVVAHEMGVVHRDLKPENIMVIDDPSHPYGERVKVLDFGIAKILDTASPGEDHDPRVDALSMVTRAGTFIGTPAYMSPEQCGLLAVDTRADIYTCGVLLFQLVTGQLPFEGETPLHTATLHIHAPVPAPSAFAPGIDPRLDALIVKALSKKPAERHQTARHLGASLRKILDDLEDVAVGVGPVSRRQQSSVLPREGMMSPMPALPPLPPLPRRIPGFDELPREPVREVSIESARTLVSGPDAGPPPAVLLHAATAAAEPTTPRTLDRTRVPTADDADTSPWSAESLPEIPLQAPLWSEAAGEASQAGEEGDDEPVEDESTLTMVRAEILLRPPVVRVNMASSAGDAQDGMPAGREVKATLRSAADFGLSSPERRAEIEVVGIDGAASNATTAAAPPTPQSPQFDVPPHQEAAPKRAINTIRMSPPHISSSNPLPTPSQPMSSLPTAPGQPSALAAPPLQMPSALAVPPLQMPSLPAAPRMPMPSPAALVPAHEPRATSQPGLTAASARRGSPDPLEFAPTVVALQSSLHERISQAPPAALPQVHLVRAHEPSWLSGKRGVVIGFLAGMLITVLLMAAYLHFG